MEIKIERAFLDLFNRIENLKEGEVLHTSFGPDNYYVIEKINGEDDFMFTEYRNKYSFQERGSLEQCFTFSIPQELRRGILSRPNMYATNHFTRELQHHDNWINLVNGFKLKKLVHHTEHNMYLYEEVK